MTYAQSTTFEAWKDMNRDYRIVEGLTLYDNCVFGPTAYFTARFGNQTYIEFGIKPNGDIFTVR